MNDMTSHRPPNRGGFRALASGLRHGLQWRLLLASTLLLLLPTLFLALPIAGWLQAQFAHSLQAAAIAGGNDVPLLLEGLSRIGKQGAWLRGSAAGATLLALLLSPWLTGMVLASIRTGYTLRMGALLRAGLGEYLRMRCGDDATELIGAATGLETMFDRTATMLLRDALRCGPPGR